MQLTLSMHFTNEFYKSIFIIVFPIFQKNIRNWKNSFLELFMSLKVTGIVPNVYKGFCDFFKY
jgi:hypothetical protein